MRELLRSLPSFPDAMPTFEPQHVPDDPLPLFMEWLTEAIASGERQPAAMTVTTVDEHGVPASRTLIIKDVDERGIQFASSRTSRKGLHLAARPDVTLLCFWRPLGRQVEITGDAVALDEATSRADWRDRPSFDGIDNPDWQVWAVHPRRFEFMQATHDRQHVRVEYTRGSARWNHRRLAASEQRR
jgi:pyridoxamine 5'-phosphate oxidase